MKTFLHSRDGADKGAALMIVLAFVVLLTGLVLAYFSRTTTDRQLAQSSYTDTSSDLLARSALDIVVRDFKQDILSGQPVSTTNIEPPRYGDDASIPNLIRRSVQGTGVTSTISSTSVSANGRSISKARWNNHYLIPRRPPVPPETWDTVYSDPVSTFTAPDWVLVTAQAPTATPLPGEVIGRYAFAAYDEGGLLDMNLAGYPSWSGNVNPNPAPSPTPWLTNVGRKGIIAFADLTALPDTPTTKLAQSQVDKIVGWRNWATTQQTGGSSFGNPNFSSGNMNNRQDAWGTYLFDFGEPPYSTPCPLLPFTAVDTSVQSSKTDQALMNRQELLKLQNNLGFSQNVLQFMGTFSRERNQPARDWNRLRGRLPDRYDIGQFGMVKPNPPGSWTPRGRGQGHGGGGFKGRGHYKGDAAIIRDRFGLVWVAGDTNITDPHNVNYWGHWLYVGAPGLPSNPNPHIPLLRGPASRNDLFQILDFAMTQANADDEDIDPLNVADVFALGASLIDQYDSPNPGQPDDDADPRTGTHVTIIKTGQGVGDFVLGWENVCPVGAPNCEVAAANDTNQASPRNPYNWITNTGLSTGTKKPLPGGFTPIVLNHAFSTTGDLGYGLRSEYVTNRFQRLDFHTDNLNATLLDFFAYNPVDHNYPRLGITSLNTKNKEVIAAILQSALKKDIDTASLPNPFPTVAPSEAAAAAQAILNATNPSAGGTRVTSRAGIGRLTAAAASAIGNPGYTAEELEKLPEVIARALSEIGQARTWNLMIDVIAQTGRYTPGTTPPLDNNNANKFIVEGEKRYWLHIALGRDLVSGTVDVLGTQLEQVPE